MSLSDDRGAPQVYRGGTREIFSLDSGGITQVAVQDFLDLQTSPGLLGGKKSSELFLQKLA